VSAPKRLALLAAQWVRRARRTTGVQSLALFAQPAVFRSKVDEIALELRQAVLQVGVLAFQFGDRSFSHGFLPYPNCAAAMAPGLREPS